VDHAATDCETTVGYEGTVEVAATKTREALVGSACLLAAGVIAIALTDDHEIPPIAVVVIAAVVAGEQLWHRRRHIPRAVPVTIVHRDDPVASAMPVVKALFIAAMFVVFVLLSSLISGGSAAMLGFLAGYVVRDLVMTIRVAWWQKRHDQVLAWVGSGGEDEPRILL
jgi:hypothetical protein